MTNNSIIIQEYIAANSKIAQNYFQFTTEVLGLVEDNPKKIEILEKLLIQTEEITNKFIEAHKQLLIKDNLVLNEHLVLDNAQLQDNQEESNTRRLKPIKQLGKIQEKLLSPKEWLRDKLVEMTGYEANCIDFSIDFSDIGLDSLSILDLHEAVGQQYPLLAKNYQYDEMNTPQKLLDLILTVTSESYSDLSFNEKESEQTIRNIISDLTGFSFNEVDLSLSFDDLGIDSLGRIEFLEALQTTYPSIKNFKDNITDLLDLTPKEIANFLEKKILNINNKSEDLKESLFYQLEQFSVIDKFDEETPFSQYLTDGFMQARVWENMSQKFDSCQFAGEALMSRRNINEALNLLSRLG